MPTHRDPSFHLRIKAELMAATQEIAEAEHRSVNNQIQKWITEKVAEYRANHPKAKKHANGAKAAEHVVPR